MGQRGKGVPEDRKELDLHELRRPGGISSGKTLPELEAMLSPEARKRSSSKAARGKDAKPIETRMMRTSRRMKLSDLGSSYGAKGMAQV
jgi:hypothetical protein